MKSLALVVAASLAVAAPVAMAQDYDAGMADLQLADPAGDRDLSGLLWYPTEADGTPSAMFDSAVWVSPLVRKEAVPAEGPFPLIVVSHGMFGNSYNQAWFATEMAARGYIVAAVDHPGTSTWSREPALRKALWERPGDVSRVIDAALSPGVLSVEADPDRIYMAGHSLGGFTAALLAGARYDAAHFEQFCASAGPELVCDILNGWGIAKSDEDRLRMEADLSDPRIRAFAIFDLGGTQAFSPDSLGQIDRPMLVYGAPVMNSGLNLDIESRAFVAALPEAHAIYLEPEGYAHFDFMGLCKPEGHAILVEEEPEDAIVCENGSAERAAKHQSIVDRVSAVFDAS